MGELAVVDIILVLVGFALGRLTRRDPYATAEREFLDEFTGGRR